MWLWIKQKSMRGHQVWGLDKSYNFILPWACMRKWEMCKNCYRPSNTLATTASKAALPCNGFKSLLTPCCRGRLVFFATTFHYKSYLHSIFGRFGMIWGYISESFKKVRQTFVWQTVPKFWFLYICEFKFSYGNNLLDKAISDIVLISLGLFEEIVSIGKFEFT